MTRFYLLFFAVLMTYGLNAQTLPLVINEIDYDQPSTDTREFIELKNTSDTTISLSGVSIVLINGSSGAAYNTTDLPDTTLAAGAYFVICYGNNIADFCDLTVASSLQNGAPDGVELLFNGERIDAVSYEGNIDGLVEGTGIETGDNNNDDELSISRSPDGVDTDDNNADFILACASPGSSNNTSRSCEVAGDSSMVQIIHNAPSPVVDIYANGELIADDFTFRSATPFRNFPSGINIEIAIAGADSESAADSLAQFNLVLVDSLDYVIYARGVLGSEETPFGLDIFDMAKTSANSPAILEILTYHGAPDAPTVDLRLAGTTLIDNVNYGSFEGYLPLLPGTYTLQLTPGNDNNTTLANFAVDVNDFAGATLNVFASGFLEEEPAFGLWVAMTDGTTFGLEQVFLDSADVQIIHNVPDVPVDIYANGELILQDFEYLNATPFLKLAADLETEIAIAPAPSISAEEAIASATLTFGADVAYTFVANGTAGSDTDPVGIEINDMARTVSATDTTVDLNVFHGAVTAPGVYISALGVGPLFDSVAYKAFTEYLSVAPTAYTLEIKPEGTEEVVASFDADLSTLGGGAVTVLAHGELGNEANPFSLLAVLADGTTINIPETPTANVQIIHNSPTPTVDIYADGELLLNDFAFRTATPFLELPAEVDIELAVAPDTSTSAASAIANFTVNFEGGGEYLVVAGGVVGDTMAPFNLFINEMARSVAMDSSKVEFTTFHGAPGAPAVDLDARSTGNLFTNLSFGNFSAYNTLDPITQYLDIKVSGFDGILGTFEAQFDTLAGQSVTLLASGFLIGDPGFAPLAVLADGTVIELQSAAVANVQVIHNAIAPTVDIYANGELLIDNFAFRTATPFQLLPAGVEIDLAVAPDTSTSAASAIANFPVTFENGSEYLIIANGELGNNTFPFNLEINEMARSRAASEGNVDVLVFHGSIGAPGVDIDARTVGNLFSELSYTQFTDYSSITPGEYYLDIKIAGLGTLLATYFADFNTYADQSVTLIASGFLLTQPSFVPLAVLADGTVIELQPASVANVQVIHNAIAPTVDIYANGELLIDDFEFRNATPFQLLPAGVEIDLAIAPDTSTSAASAIANFPVTFENGSEYLVIANGELGNNSFPFNLEINEMARSRAESEGNVDIVAFHGSIGAPAVDVDARTVGNLFSGLDYAQYTDYVSVAPGEYILDLKVAGLQSILATYSADLTTYADQSVTLIASGFLLTQPSFVPLAVLADGTVIELQATTVANVQVIHNSPTPTVDVYANGEILIDNFQFRTATPFQFLQAGVDIELAIAPGNSASAEEAIFRDTVNLVNGSEYLIIANGVVGDENFPFNLAINEMARSTSETEGGVDVVAFHGSPGAPTVDVDARNVGNLFSELSFGLYTDYITVDPAVYYLDLKLSGVDAIAFTYLADLSALGDQAVTIVASGFFIGQPGFAPLAVLNDGTVIELPTAPVASVQLLHNSPTPVVDIYVNDELIVDNFEYREATPFTFLPSGDDVRIDVAPDTSSSAASSIFNTTLSLENGENYIAIASGIVGDEQTPFSIEVRDGARINAQGGSGIDLLFYHGSTDAPEVDVLALSSPVFENVSFGEYQGYFNIPSASYILDVTPAEDNSDILASYVADVTSLEGQAALVFATGFFSGEEPGFGVWVALADGTTFPLQTPTATNELETIVEGLKLFPNPVQQQANLTYTLKESTDISINIFNQNGQLVRTKNLGRQIQGAHNEIIEVNDLTKGQYYLSLISTKGIITTKMVVIK